MSQLTEAAELRLEASLETAASAAAQAVGALGAEADIGLRARDSEPRPRLSAQSSPSLPRGWAMRPSLRAADREQRAPILELEQLLRRLAPDDIERLLGYARRLAR